jgi:hypothetical protein
VDSLALCSQRADWRPIRTAILACTARRIDQTHADAVTAKLANGRVLRGREPAIDAIFVLLSQAHCDTSKLVVSTE